MNEAYKRQVKLLLEVLPEVAKENCFAMHGGTAINLFVRDMPRLSVDIDLTYVELNSREEALAGIHAGLLSIKQRIEALRHSISVQHRKDVCKLQIEGGDANIKIEVNMIGRGLLDNAEKMVLCNAAQEAFDAFCTMPIVPLAQLYGGKICAALDRQHPRDIFDVKLLLDTDGLSNEIKRGLVYSLICSNRPTHELLAPNLLDQRSAFENQFRGMSVIDFTYDELETTRIALIDQIRAGLGDEEKAFLFSLNRLEPDWSVYNYQDFPAVKWKLYNLERFKAFKPDEYMEQLKALEGVLKS